VSNQCLVNSHLKHRSDYGDAVENTALSAILLKVSSSLKR